MTGTDWILAAIAMLVVVVVLPFVVFFCVKLGRSAWLYAEHRFEEFKRKEKSDGKGT